MIHTYSLIHDDLPCMDNDDLRRGHPTNHRVYGEGMAVIAGDALQALAFDVMLRPEVLAAVGAERAARAAHTLAVCAGAYGMCGGQAIDLLSEGHTIPLETLQEMDNEKTGALISSAVQMGCIIAGAGAAQMAAAGVMPVRWPCVPNCGRPAGSCGECGRNGEGHGQRRGEQEMRMFPCLERKSGGTRPGGNGGSRGGIGGVFRGYGDPQRLAVELATRKS